MTRRSMKLTLMAGAAACIFSGPALANDWEGLSLGIGGGYGMANTKVGATPTGLGDILNETTNGAPGANGFFTLSAGYDHALLGTLVVGGFVDYDFSDINSRLPSSLLLPIDGSFSLGNQLSVGGRIGYLVAPTTLFFSTFGYAHAEGSDAVVNLGFDKARGSTDSFNGYFFGGGVETLIGGGFSLKAEYRYTSLQAEDAIVRPELAPSESLTATIKPQIQTARVSLNYRFGNGKQEPVDNSIPPVTSSWTSPYIGLGAGYGVADNEGSLGFVPSPSSPELRQGFGNDGGFLSFTAGYDYQFNRRFVAGVFGDADFSNLHYQSGFNITDGTDSLSFDERAKFNNIFMLGGRLGYLTAPDTMVFVSGGYANAGLSDTTASLGISGLGSGSVVLVDGKRFSGGFVGGGVETRINDSLSLKAEYRYIDLGSENMTLLPDALPQINEIISTKFDPTIQMGRLSINYRFGSPAESSSAPLK